VLQGYLDEFAPLGQAMVEAGTALLAVPGARATEGDRRRGPLGVGHPRGPRRPPAKVGMTSTPVISSEVRSKALTTYRSRI
jgi:hypothetical protein